MPRLAAREARLRRHSPPIRHAWRHQSYDRTAPVAEIEKDLALLRALASRGVSRRILLAMLIGASFVGGLVLASAVREASAVVLALPVALFFGLLRRFVRVWQVRRIDLASGILRSLAIPGGHDVAMHLDLRKTGIRANRVARESVTAHEHYQIDWLVLDAPLADGARIRIGRRERLAYLEQRFRRSVRRSWSFEMEDDVEIRLPDAPGGYRSTAAISDPESRFHWPKEFLRQRFETSPTRLSLAMRSGLVWGAPGEYPVPERTLDGVATLRGWIANLYEIAGQSAPLVDPGERTTASFFPIGPRDVGVVVLLAALAPIPFALEAGFKTAERLSYGEPLASIGQAGEAAAAGGCTIVGLAGAIWLFAIPAMLARRAAREP